MVNSTTNWLMVALTFIYVVATVRILVMNKKSLNATKDEVEEIKREWELSEQPHILVYFEVIRSGIICFVIENDGKRPAINTKIEISDDFVSNLPDKNDRSHVNDLNKSTFFIAPRQKFYVSLGLGPDFVNIAKVKAQIKATYSDNSYNSFNFSENYEIDLNNYTWQIMYNSPLDDIHQVLKKIGDKPIR